MLICIHLWFHFPRSTNMPVCSKCAVEHVEGVSESSLHPLPLSSAPSNEDQKDRELFLDNAFAAAVIGGTAQFISFLLVLTTQATVSLLENLLLSAFIGLCLGCIAYALLTGYDQISSQDRETASEGSYQQMPDTWA
jgi:hypothetical protein